MVRHDQSDAMALKKTIVGQDRTEHVFWEFLKNEALA
jgi:hypothetical protein